MDNSLFSLSYHSTTARFPSLPLDKSRLLIGQRCSLIIFTRFNPISYSVLRLPYPTLPFPVVLARSRRAASRWLRLCLFRAFACLDRSDRPTSPPLGGGRHEVRHWREAGRRAHLGHRSSSSSSSDGREATRTFLPQRIHVRQ